MGHVANWERMKLRGQWAGAFLSFIVAFDLLLSLLCSGLPLIMYLLVGGFGAWIGPKLREWFSKRTGVSKFLRVLVPTLACASAIGILVLLILPVHWNGKCAYRYCGRALGMGLMTSPYPVGEPSCRGWSICINEYSFKPGEREDALERLRKQGGPEP